MERYGFIRDMMDVKILILFVTARLNAPATIQEIYELCYQDEKLTYFDVCDAVPDLVKSGHLEESEEGRYAITDLGRDTISVLYRAHLCMKCSFGIFNFLEEISSLSHSIFFPLFLCTDC